MRGVTTAGKSGGWSVRGMFDRERVRAMTVDVNDGIIATGGIVEGFSAAGVPCFVADVKGDLAGLAMAGSPTGKNHAIFAGRAAEIAMQGWAYRETPVQLWDLFGEQGHPVRTTVTEMGPLLLSRLMNLNEVQEGVLSIAFKVADERGLLLVDLDDLQALLVHIGEDAAAH